MKQKQYNNINFLRILCTMIIIFYHILHANIMSYVGDNVEYTILQALSTNAAYIVECFFIMGGYFLYLESMKANNSFGDYAIKRVKRLWPSLAISTIISVLCFGQSIYVAVFNLTFLQTVGFSVVYQGVNWYVSPFFWCSLLIYGIYFVLDRRKALLVVSVMVYFSYLVNLSTSDGGFGRETVLGFVNLALCRGIAGVGLGTLICAIHQWFLERKNTEIESKLTSIMQCAIFTFLEIGSFSFLMYYFIGGGDYGSHFIVVIMFVVLFCCFLAQKGVLSILFDRKIFHKLSQYCYAIYVMQQISFYLLQRSLWKWEWLIARVGVTISVSILCSILLGIIVYYVAEYPINRKN